MTAPPRFTAGAFSFAPPPLPMPKKAAQTPRERSQRKPAKSPAPKRPKPTAGHVVDLAAILTDDIRPRWCGTQSELAEAIGTSPAVLSQLMTGYRSPSLDQLSALAEAVGGRIVVRFESPAKTGKKRG